MSGGIGIGFEARMHLASGIHEIGRKSPTEILSGKRVGAVALFFVLAALFFVTPMFRGLGLAAEQSGAPKDEAATAADRAAVREVADLTQER